MRTEAAAPGAGARVFESYAGDGEGAGFVFVGEGAAAEEESRVVESADRARACFGCS